MLLRRRSCAAVGLSLIFWPGIADAVPPPIRVFRHQQAKVALEIAQRECKPLLVHFASDERRVGEVIRKYYGSNSPIPRAQLARVVIVVLPRNKYGGFAEQLGVYESGGIRTISPYDMSFGDKWHLTTTRTQSRVTNWFERRMVDR